MTTSELKKKYGSFKEAKKTLGIKARSWEQLKQLLTNPDPFKAFKSKYKSFVDAKRIHGIKARSWKDLYELVVVAGQSEAESNQTPEEFTPVYTIPHEETTTATCDLSPVDIDLIGYHVKDIGILSDHDRYCEEDYYIAEEAIKYLFGHFQYERNAVVLSQKIREICGLPDNLEDALALLKTKRATVPEVLTEIAKTEQGPISFEDAYNELINSPLGGYLLTFVEFKEFLLENYLYDHHKDITLPNMFIPGIGDKEPGVQVCCVAGLAIMEEKDLGYIPEYQPTWRVAVYDAKDAPAWYQDYLDALEDY
jgi:hypothetical protein